MTSVVRKNWKILDLLVLIDVAFFLTLQEYTEGTACNVY
jgi:hypothetical protein